MNAPALLERADAYLRYQSRDSRSAGVASGPPRGFITISRQAGSGGSSLARILNATSESNESWHVYEGNLTVQMLQQNRLPSRLARYLPEDRIAEPDASIGEMIGLHPNLWELVQKTNQTVRQLAGAGHVILVGRGANFATADLVGGFHVRLIASVEHRASYLARRYGISESEARAHNDRCDAARRRYVRATFNTDVTDPAAYHLTINTGQITLTDAAQLIWSQLRARARPSERTNRVQVAGSSSVWISA
ncbi:MAG: cytidylate kinase family protein [Opitutus sp.]